MHLMMKPWWTCNTGHSKLTSCVTSVKSLEGARFRKEELPVYYTVDTENDSTELNESHYQVYSILNHSIINISRLFLKARVYISQARKCLIGFSDLYTDWPPNIGELFHTIMPHGNPFCAACSHSYIHFRSIGSACPRPLPMPTPNSETDSYIFWFAV